MATGNEFLDTVRAIHAAGLNEALWPDALRALCNIFDAPSGDIEIADKRTMRLVGFHGHGVPPVAEISYASEYMKRNPRVHHAFLQRAGEIGYDRLHIDEAGMRADPFYSEFLTAQGIRYYISTVLANNADQFAGICINRTARAGHAEEADLALMQRLMPHLQQAYEANQRLAGVPHRAERMLESVLDSLADGLVIVAADGSLRFANEAARPALTASSSRPAASISSRPTFASSTRMRCRVCVRCCREVPIASPRRLPSAPSERAARLFRVGAAGRAAR